MSHNDPIKWTLPGWRIEQRYAPGVLIGNWGEERYTFKKGDTKHNSTQRQDFKNFGGSKPDVIIRRKAQLQNDDGLGPENLFHHHGNKYSNNMISWYDEHYNQRERDTSNKLPDLRNWDSHRLAWLPEKSDFPIQGTSTNFGLADKMKSKWSNQIADSTHGDFNTTYGKSYSAVASTRSGSNDRIAVPRSHSSKLHQVNKVNRDMHFRGTPCLQAPEPIPKHAAPALT